MVIKKGDKVRIKSWEQMELEFGLDRLGDIACNGAFVANMLDFCGQTVEVTSTPYPEDDYFGVVEDEEGWTFSTDMVAEVISE